MLPIFGYLAAVGALFVGAALGLMVLLGESAGIGKNFAAYADAKAAATAKPMRLAGADLDASAAARTIAAQEMATMVNRPAVDLYLTFARAMGAANVTFPGQTAVLPGVLT